MLIYSLTNTKSQSAVNQTTNAVLGCFCFALISCPYKNGNGMRLRSDHRCLVELQSWQFLVFVKTSISSALRQTLKDYYVLINELKKEYKWLVTILTWYLTSEYAAMRVMMSNQHFLSFRLTIWTTSTLSEFDECILHFTLYIPQHCSKKKWLIIKIRIPIYNIKYIKQEECCVVSSSPTRVQSNGATHHDIIRTPGKPQNLRPQKNSH